MRRLGIVVALALTLAGCQSFGFIQQTWEAAKSAVVSKDGVVLAVSAFHAVERSATIYINQVRCPKNVIKPTCMSPVVREQLAVALDQGQKARDGLIDFADDHPGAIGDQGLYDALKAATATLKNIFGAYKIRSVS